MSEAHTMQPMAETASRGPAPGVRLAEARQAQELTPADVARQLKLSVWQIEALEAGRYQQLPGPIFVRGFIRNYARLVKLDPEELLQAAGDSLPQSAHHAELPPSQNIPFPAASRRRWPALAAITVAVVGVLAVYEFYWNDPAPPAAAVSPSPVPSEARETATEPAITVAAAAQTARDVPEDMGARPEPDRVTAPGARQIRLVFDQESWVEIRDRNERTILFQLNRPGTEQLVSGVPPFSIVVGNSHGVRMTYDGKPVDLAQHTRIDVARLILQ